MSGEIEVVITGLGAVSALGMNLDEHEERRLRGEIGIVERPTRDGDLPLRFWAPVRGFKPREHIRQRMLRKLLQPSAAMGIAAGGEALRQAGLEGEEDLLEEAGIFLGSVTFELSAGYFAPAIAAGVGRDGRFDFARFAERGLLEIDPLLIVKGLPNAALCGISIEFGIRGPSLNLANGSLAGLQAISAARDAIAHGELEIAVVGACDSLMQPEPIAQAWLAGRLLGSDPEAAERGYVPGEGAAICILESAAHARARRVKALATLVATSERSAAPSDVDGLGLVVEEVLRAGQREKVPRPPRVFGDGKNLIDEDAAEARALREHLSPDVQFESPTHALGFTGAAHGMFSLLHAVRAVARKEAPSALVWHSDAQARHGALLLAAS